MSIDLNESDVVDADGNIINPASRENQALEIAQLTAINAKLAADFGASSAAVRTASIIGNATGGALFGAGTTTAQVLRVVLPTDQSAIPVTQSGTWNINNISGTISLPTDAATASNQTNNLQTTQLVNSSGNAVAVKTLGSTPLAADYGLETNSLMYGLTTAGGGGYVPVKVNPSGTMETAANQSGTWNINNISGTISLPTGAATELTLAAINTKLANDFGASSGAIRTAAQIGNATGAALFGAGTTTAQVLRVVIATDQTSIPAAQSGTWTTGRTWTLASGTDSIASVQSGSWTTGRTWTLSSGTDSVAVSNFPATVSTDYGAVSASTIRTASQIGNATGAANFNAGASGAQTLRVSANITRNGTELSYGIAASDANTLRTAALLANAAGVVDYSHGTVGVQTIRVAAVLSNESAKADFAAGVTGTATLRTTSNITRNGTELSYNAGTSDANTLRTSSNLYNNGTALDYNFGAASANSIRIAALIGNATGAADFNAGASSAQTLRVSANITRNGTELSYGSGAIDANTLRIASILGNAAGVIDYNYGTVGAQTVRTASHIGNSTGAASFNAGATGAQTLRVASNLYDGSANAIASTSINSKQRLDVNTASEGTDGGVDPFQTTLVGGSDGTNLRALATDTSGRLITAGSSYFHPIYSLRVQAVNGTGVALATSLAIPIASTSSGNFIAVAVSSSVAGTVTVTDNLAQTYTSAISGTSGTHTSYIFYKANTAAGVTTVTINSTSSSGLIGIVTEYFGISTSSPLDKTSTGNVAVAAFSSGSTATTTSTNELLLGSAHGIAKNNLTYTAGTNWTSVGTSLGFSAATGQLYLEDQYVSGLAAYSATGTASANDTIIADIATFVISNTNLIVINRPKVVKSGPGILRRVIINSIGVGSPTLTMYDNTTNSGNVIGIISLLGVTNSMEYNLNFTTGLTIVSNSTSSDYTLVYD